MKRSAWMAVILTSLMIGAACTPAPETTTKGPRTIVPGETAADRTGPFIITMIAKSSNNPVFLSARTGAEAAAKELSGTAGREIVIDWRTPPTEDGQVQAQNIAAAANEGSEVILLSCSDASKVNGAISDAHEKGVYTWTFDSDAPESVRIGFYGVDDVETGQRVMDELVGVAGKNLKVGVLAGNQNAPNLQKRVQGVQEAAKKHPGVEIVGVYYHNETPADAAAKVKEVMLANPQINAWAMVGGWPLFTTTLLNDLDPNKVKIVAVDALPAQLPYVEAGIAPVLLAQPTYKWGYESVQLIVRKLLKLEQVPPVTKMELVRVTKDNLGEWAKQLQDWGFTDVDPKYLQASTP